MASIIKRLLNWIDDLLEYDAWMRFVGRPSPDDRRRVQGGPMSWKIVVAGETTTSDQCRHTYPDNEGRFKYKTCAYWPGIQACVVINCPLRAKEDGDGDGQG